MSTGRDEHVIAEISIPCDDEKSRTLYVKFENEKELYKHNDEGFENLLDRFQAALHDKYPGEECDVDDIPEIMRMFTISEDGKTMKSTYVVDGTNELFVEFNLEA
jgi:hypothetical protein